MELFALEKEAIRENDENIETDNSTNDFQCYIIIWIIDLKFATVHRCCKLYNLCPTFISVIQLIAFAHSTFFHAIKLIRNQLTHFLLSFLFIAPRSFIHTYCTILSTTRTHTGIEMRVGIGVWGE